MQDDRYITICKTYRNLRIDLSETLGMIVFFFCIPLCMRVDHNTCVLLNRFFDLS